METIEHRSIIEGNGKILIPAAYRRALGVGAGDGLVLRMHDGELRIRSLKEAVGRARQKVKKLAKGKNLNQILFEMRREDKSQ